MAAVLIAAPFVRSKALRDQAFVAEVGGVQARKRLRVSCRPAAATASGERRTVSVLRDVACSQDEMSIGTSSNASLSDWIVNFLLKEDVPEQAPEAAVAAPTRQVLEPVVASFEATEVRQRERRRSERAVVFTEEKARRLRKENRATQTFHDKWYHSAIASRLAIPE